MKSERLKLGIITDSYQVPTWIYRSYERILDLDIADFLIIILVEDKSSKTKGPPRHSDTFVFEMYTKIDEKLFHAEPDSLKLMDLRHLLPNVSSVNMYLIQDTPPRLSESTKIDRVNEYGLDILFSPEIKALPVDIVCLAKYGVWTYFIGDSGEARGSLPGFWDVMEGNTEICSTLSMLGKDRLRKQIIYQSWLFTYLLSPSRNRNYINWASSSLLPRQVEQLYRLGEERFLKVITERHQEQDGCTRPEYKIPSNLMALKLTIRMTGRILKEIYRRLFYPDAWFLLFDRNREVSTEFNSYKRIFPPKDRFWADPHVLFKDNRYFIFIEEYPYKTKKGHISVIEMDEGGYIKEPVRILEKDYHLSFPFVFEWEGKVYMVPESADNKTIDLYECVDFPYQWKLLKTIMSDVQAVDTILLYHQERWWLFTAMADNEGAFPQVELFLFYADNLFSDEWQPHPLNPIISDVKKARMAGKVFISEGKIFRPSQDCSKGYGFGIDLNEINILSETEYQETRVESIRPGWDNGILATHTFAHERYLTVIDALIKRRIFF